LEEGMNFVALNSEAGIIILFEVWIGSFVGARAPPQEQISSFREKL
jgi:hypothetical protein